jgi:hypothetical protein
MGLGGGNSEACCIPLFTISIHGKRLIWLSPLLYRRKCMCLVNQNVVGAFIYYMSILTWLYFNDKPQLSHFDLTFDLDERKLEILLLLTFRHLGWMWIHPIPRSRNSIKKYLKYIPAFIYKGPY